MISENHEIKWIVYNWFWSPQENSEGYIRATVGSNGITLIEEHRPSNGLEQHFFDIHEENGRVTRVFNVNSVGYQLKEQK